MARLEVLYAHTIELSIIVLLLSVKLQRKEAKATSFRALTLQLIFDIIHSATAASVAAARSSGSLQVANDGQTCTPAPQSLSRRSGRRATIRGFGESDDYFAAAAYKSTTCPLIQTLVGSKLCGLLKVAHSIRASSSSSSSCVVGGQS